MSSHPSDKDIGAEIRRVSHELNNLMAVLFGHSEAMSRTMNPSDPAKKHLDAILEALTRSGDASRRLSAILNGIDPSELGPLLIPSSTPQQVLSGKETVLLADDEAALRSVTARFLSMNGYKVLEAGNADQARAVYDDASGAVDVVVTDVTMGASSGLDLARALKEKNPTVKVLFVSGNRPPGMEDATFLPKPFRPKDLLRRLREMLDAGGQRAVS